MKKILLVEDDKGLQEIYGVRLEAEGYNTVFANNGEEAINIVMKEKPDLILSDVMMPKISGFDMLDILKSNESLENTKVIVMTALSSEDQRERGESLGVDKYLVKSQVGIEDVINAINEVLNPETANSNNPNDVNNQITEVQPMTEEQTNIQPPNEQIAVEPINPVLNPNTETTLENNEANQPAVETNIDQNQILENNQISEENNSLNQETEQAIEPTEALVDNYFEDEKLEPNSIQNNNPEPVKLEKKDVIPKKDLFSEDLKNLPNTHERNLSDLIPPRE